MMAGEGPIRADRGRLAARRSDATSELLAAIGAAERDETRLGAQGIGVVLASPARAESPAVAHVLPLSGGALRPGLVPRAAAAVFVSPPLAATPVATAARALALTPAETRLLEHLVAGETLAEAAERIGVAETTAKAQLRSIFDKAGVRRQAELIALVARLAPPLGG
jgi:DNA-binding CsgD family transcriptional regulator